jgi:hypothetical protein
MAQNNPYLPDVPEELLQLRRWAMEVKVRHETETLAQIKKRVEQGDTAALDEVSVSSTGNIEFNTTTQRPYLPPASAPTNYRAKSRAEFNAYVRDCEDVFERNPLMFKTDDQKVGFSKQYLDDQRKAIWKKYCEEMKTKHDQDWYPTWDDLKDRMLNCLGTPLQRKLKAHNTIKACHQRTHQSPTELLDYLQPLWDEAEVIDPDQQLADYITALDPNLKRLMGVIMETPDLTLMQVQERASNLWQDLKYQDNASTKSEGSNKRKGDPNNDNRGRNGSNKHHKGQSQPGGGGSGNASAVRHKCYACGRIGHIVDQCKDKKKVDAYKAKRAEKSSGSAPSKNGPAQKD